MKILFICGSLAPGRDGVGDYTLRLAGELIRQGHQASIIALNDRLIDTLISTKQEVDGITVPVLRLPSIVSNKERFFNAAKYIEVFNPEWLSLQFVPFSFQDKGLPLGLGRGLAKIGKGRKWHVMFHELWIGRDKFIYSTTNIISFLQQIIITNLIKNISPTLIHTHLPSYKINLQTLGVFIHELPIFSNIAIYPMLKKNKFDDKFRISFFSQADANFEIIYFLTEIIIQLLSHNFNIELAFIGGNIEKMQSIGQIIQTEIPQIQNIVYTGHLNEFEISFEIQKTKLGITPIPRHALGKSGSVAAFISHGIPVAAPCQLNNKDEIGFFNENLIKCIMLEPKLDEFNSLKELINENKKGIALDLITTKFCDDLNTTRK